MFKLKWYWCASKLHIFLLFSKIGAKKLEEGKPRGIDRLLFWPQSKTEEGTQQVKSNPKTTFV